MPLPCRPLLSSKETGTRGHSLASGRLPSQCLDLACLQFAKSGMDLLSSDAAFFVSRLLFQHYPIPPTVADIKAVDLKAPNLLVDVMELTEEETHQLQALAACCESKADLMAKMSDDSGVARLCTQRA